MKNIILCGFMGCGKSTIGKALSDICEMSFIDTDSFIENKTGLTIAEIFQKYGEAHFRNLEKATAEELSFLGGCVIATGGGMLLNPDVADIFRKNGIIVFLDTPLNIISERLKGDSTRPLLLREDRDDYIHKLYNERYPKYSSAANMLFDTSGLSAIDSAKAILTEIKKKQWI